MLDTPLGPITLNENRQATGTVFINEVVDDGAGRPQERDVSKAENVNQTLGMTPEEFQAMGLALARHAGLRGARQRRLNPASAGGRVVGPAFRGGGRLLRRGTSEPARRPAARHFGRAGRCRSSPISRGSILPTACSRMRWAKKWTRLGLRRPILICDARGRGRRRTAAARKRSASERRSHPVREDGGSGRGFGPARGSGADPRDRPRRDHRPRWGAAFSTLRGFWGATGCLSSPSRPAPKAWGSVRLPGSVERLADRPAADPAAILCDPTLTLSASPADTAAAGMDALVHCLEAFLSTAYNPPADGIALDGLRRAVR